MSGTMRAYFAESDPHAYARAERVHGHVLRRPGGLRLGRSVERAIVAGWAWPVALYEVDVQPEDVLAEGRWADAGEDPTPLAAAVRIAREVPLEEVFGPNIAAIQGLFADLPRYPWLAPSRDFDVEALAPFVRAFSDANPGERVAAGATLLQVRNWDEAHDVRLACAAEFARRPGTEPMSDVHPMRLAPISAARWTARVGAYQVGFLPAWQAGWRQATRHVLSNIARRGAEQEKTAELIESIGREFLAACNASQGSPWEIARRIEGSDSHPPRDDRDIRAQLAHAERIRYLIYRGGHEVIDMWAQAVCFARVALDIVSEVTGAWVGAPNETPAASPLLDMFRHGVWPIGTLKEQFAVYVPPGGCQMGAGPTLPP
jgi:hypothetical protein